MGAVERRTGQSPLESPPRTNIKSKPTHRMAPGERTLAWVSRVIIWLVIGLSIVPMWFVVEASINPSNSYFSVTLIPPHPSLYNYVQLLTTTQFGVWVRNSLIVGFSVGTGQVLLTATSAFAFSRLRFWGRRNGLRILLILQMFPNFLSIAAIYAGLSKLGMMDNLGSYILVMLGGSAFNIWLLKGYFDSIPRELDEAAIIDGANSWQRFVRILLPLAVPMLIVIFLFTLMGSFSEYLLAGTILQSPSNFTLGVGLYGFIYNQFGKNWGQFSAAAVLSAVPLAVIFGLMQRYVTSVIGGSLKG